MAYVPEQRPCPSCGAIIQRQRVDGIYALTKVEKKQDGGITFFPSHGIPVVVSICPNCREITLHSAKALGEI